MIHSKPPADPLVHDFRAAMRQLAATVCVVTAGTGDGRRGLTATAVCSLSITPPSMLVCVNRQGAAHRAITENGCFCVNILGADQLDVAHRFAGQTGAGENKFVVGRLEPSENRCAGARRCAHQSRLHAFVRRRDGKPQHLHRPCAADQVRRREVAAAPLRPQLLLPRKPDCTLAARRGSRQKDRRHGNQRRSILPGLEAGARHVQSQARRAGHDPDQRRQQPADRRHGAARRLRHGRDRQRS